MSRPDLVKAWGCYRLERRHKKGPKRVPVSATYGELLCGPVVCASVRGPSEGPAITGRIYRHDGVFEYGLPDRTPVNWRMKWPKRKDDEVFQLADDEWDE